MSTEENKTIVQWEGLAEVRRLLRLLLIILVEVFVFALLGLVYWMVISEGLRYLFEPLGQRLYKIPIPVFRWLQNDPGLRKLDLAHCFSIVPLMIATWWLCKENVRILLGIRPRMGGGANAVVHTRFVQWLGGVIVGGDAFLFYTALTQMSGWGGMTFSFTKLLATLIYVAGIVFVSYMAVCIEGPRKEQ